MHEGGTDRYWNNVRFSKYFSGVGHDFSTKLGAFWNFLSFIVRSYMYALFSSGPRQQVKGAVVLWNQGVGVVMAAFRVFIWQIFAPQNTKTVFLTSSKYLIFSIPSILKIAWLFELLSIHLKFESSSKCINYYKTSNTQIQIHQVFMQLNAI